MNRNDTVKKISNHSRSQISDSVTLGVTLGVTTRVLVWAGALRLAVSASHWAVAY